MRNRIHRLKDIAAGLDAEIVALATGSESLTSAESWAYRKGWCKWR